MSKSYLLDTHTLLWFLSGDKSISGEVRSIICSASNKCYISIASLWEMAIKIKLGKLSLAVEFEEIANALYENDIQIMQITFDHILELMRLEEVHRDPFDRIIISTAKHEKIPVISRDINFSRYTALEVIW